MAEKDKNPETEPPTVDEQSPLEGDAPKRDADGHFTSKGKPTKGVQPVEDDDIPQTGR